MDFVIALLFKCFLFIVIIHKLYVKFGLKNLSKIFIIYYLIILIYNINELYAWKDCKVYDAIITGFSDSGAVFGTFIDDNDVVHEEVTHLDDGRIIETPLFYHSFFTGDNLAKYVGNQVKILYNYQTQETISYDEVIIDFILSLILFLCWLIIYILTRLKHK